MKIFGIILIAVLVLVSSCSPALPQDSTKEGSARPLKFGAVYQLSGPQAFYGGMARYGLELAVEDINSAGGIDGRKVVVVYEDSAGDVAKAATSAKKLTEVDDVDACC